MRLVRDIDATVVLMMDHGLQWRATEQELLRVISCIYTPHCI
jgi:hypothetical protein